MDCIKFITDNQCRINSLDFNQLISIDKQQRLLGMRYSLDGALNREMR
jgi:hypothetical protein